MSYRLHPIWWPLLILFSPLIIPYLLLKNRSFRSNKTAAAGENRRRISAAETLSPARRKQLKITVITEGKSRPGYRSEAGISYLLETEKESLLYDLGFGPKSGAFEHNFNRLDINPGNIEGVVISHLHPDHMGGLKAAKKKRVKITEVPRVPGENKNLPVFLPEDAGVSYGKPITVSEPRLIRDGVASTGPLSSNLFFSGLTEEQALIYSLKDKGKVIITGCGHPDLAVLKKMAGKIGPEKIYALVGGLHLPVRRGRMRKAGIDMQRIIGTGLPPWQQPGEEELSRTASLLNKIKPERILLSPHDSSDFTLNFLSSKLTAETDVLKSGDTFQL